MKQIILIGPPGAGKSSIGKNLAKKLEQPFCDTDQLIEEQTGKSIAEIFIDSGEAQFREIEKAVVLQVLQDRTGVIALGGGSVLDDDVQAKLQRMSGVVFLDVSISNAAPRVGFNRDRPLLVGNPRQQWIALMEKRRPIYEKLAKITISTDNKKVNEVVSELMGEFA